MPDSSPQAMREPTVRRVAALGSSFAAGPGIDPIADRAAARSAANYPHLLARLLGAWLTDLTVSGATTQTVLDASQRRGRTRFPPQILGVPVDADLVTITVGGNDLGYAGALFRQAIIGRLCAHTWASPFRAFLPGPQALTRTDEEVDRAADGLARIVDAVRGQAPGARVLLVGYLTVIGPDTRPAPDAPMDKDVLEALRLLGDQVEDVFRRAASKTAAGLVPIGERSRGHALGSAQPWVNGLPSRFRNLRGAAAFHPNADGMRAVAEAIADHLTGDTSAQA